LGTISEIKKLNKHSMDKVLSKEEIIGATFYPDECGSAIECVTKLSAMQSMDIYATQQSRIDAINFMEWKSKLHETKLFTVHPTVGLGGFHGIYKRTNEDLYDEYLKSKQ